MITRNYSLLPLWAALCLLSLAAAVAAAPPQVQTGTASYYADSLNGRPTASGAPYDKNALTAAHNSLPFGTRVRVTNLTNDKSVVVTINDRGPKTKGRIIDLSRAAASQIGMLEAGVVKVRVEIL